MAYEIPGDVRSVEAAGDLTTSFLKFVKLSGVTAVAVAAASDGAYGILQNKPAAAGQVSAIMINGISRVKVATAVAAGTAVYLTADGRADDVVQAGKCVGIALTAAANADEIIAMEIKPLGSVGA